MKHLFSSILLLLSVNFSSHAAMPAGKTIMARGDVLASDTVSLDKRQLKRRDIVFDADSISTGENSKAQFSMSDGGLIALNKNSELIIANYQFNPANNEGSASLELLKGGLRSISGLIKKNGGDYNIKTPVGSIGIRGTHFEIQLVDNDVFLAVWDGAIDLTMNDKSIVSLGQNEDFSFAQITESGEVLRSTKAPEVFAHEITTMNDQSEQGKEQSSTGSNTQTSTEEVTDTLIIGGVEVETVEVENVSNDVYTEQLFKNVTDVSLVDQIAERQGVYQYQASNFSVDSSLGAVTDFSMTMEVDFDNGTVPDGEISFTDDGGNWYASYSGLINVSELDLAITFGSHGNNRVTGDIDATFLNNLESIYGNFTLSELNNSNVSAIGSFTLKP